MRLARLLLAGSLFIILGCGSGSILLPNDIGIKTPAADVPRNAAAFLGKWGGTWTTARAGALPHILVVEEVTATTAAVIYATGDSASWNVRGSHARYKGTIEADTLIVTLPRPATVTYRMLPNGILDATYEWAGPTARTIMVKVK